MQVVSDYLTAYDGELDLLRSKNQPVCKFVYKMQMFRPRVNYQTDDGGGTIS